MAFPVTSCNRCPVSRPVQVFYQKTLSNRQFREVLDAYYGGFVDEAQLGASGSQIFPEAEPLRRMEASEALELAGAHTDLPNSQQ